MDNASTDGTVSEICVQFPKVEIIENNQNLGYAGGNNVGLKRALDLGSDYIFVVNNDTILDPDCITHLVSDLEAHSEAAAAAPRSYFLDAPEMIYFAGGSIDEWGRHAHLGNDKKDIVLQSESISSEWLNGCAILFRSKALTKIGFFDERYFLLFEDSDWSLRARQAGYDLRVVFSARLWHKGSVSFERNSSPMYIYYYVRNNLLWIERHYLLPLRLRQFYRAVKRAFGKYPSRRAVITGVFDFIFRKFGKREYSWFHTGAHSANNS